MNIGVAIYVESHTIAIQHIHPHMLYKNLYNIPSGSSRLIALKAVGAVNNAFTLCRSIVRQKLPVSISHINLHPHDKNNVTTSSPVRST